MIDYFAVLHQPRRPWLEDEALKQSYHELAFAAHPDANGQGSFQSSAALNEAYRHLRDPKLRLQHLLALESPDRLPTRAALPDDIADMFLSAGTLAHELDLVLTNARTTTTKLAQSLLRQRIAELTARTTATLAKLEELYDESLSRLRAVDAAWDGNRDLKTLRELQQRLSYLTRWLEQFREKSFQLTQRLSEANALSS